MTDRYLEFTHSAFGRALADTFGLPKPPRLLRAKGAYQAEPLAGQNILFGAARGTQLAAGVLPALAEAGAIVRVVADNPSLIEIKQVAAAHHVALNTEAGLEEKNGAANAFVFDGSGLESAADLRQLYDFLQPRIGRILPNSRVLILARAAGDIEDPEAAAANAALRGFVRSLGKEIGKRGATANLLEVGRGAENALAGPLRFFLSEHSAFVDGQCLTLTAPSKGAAQSPVFVGTLAGKVAVVTGAARGIGAAIAATLAREGARVVGIDRPQEEGALGATLAALDGYGLPLDITAIDAPQRIADELEQRFGGADIVVHNAGITRDKTLKNMSAQAWDQVLDVNLGAILRINQVLLKRGLKEGARMVCISSIGGIAGNPGQTNYGATKAGIIGYAEALAPIMAKRGGAVNAVAPGFIETQMTAAMPMGPREVGRRLSSLGQGGLPADIAEAVTFLASPLAASVNGRTLRVCGQSFVGA